MKQTGNDKTLLISCTVVFFALLAGLIHLFMLRFQSGDIYPPYSSLRYDPLGTRAFYESLSTCEGLSVERSYKPVDKLSLDPDTAILFLGDTVFTLSNEERMPKDLAAFINSFVRKGGRVVLTLLPRNVGKPSELVKALKEDEDENPTEDKPHEKKDKKADEKQKPFLRKDRERRHYLDRTIQVSKWLGLEFCDRPFESKTLARKDQSFENKELPDSISCHTSLCLSNVSSAWTVIYRRDENPVIAELKLGKGTFVLSTLTYYVSNEALRDERQPALLAWLVGDKKRIVFDEQHLGLAEQVGIAVLARQYGLEWFAGAAFLLALLFIWQRTASIIPSKAIASSGLAADLAQGKDSTSGLINLLRRSIPTAGILETCFHEWRKSQHADDKRVQAKAREMQNAMSRASGPEGKLRKPAVIYNEMAAILKKHD